MSPGAYLSSLNTTLAKDIAAALRVEEETPAAATPVAAVAAVPPIIQVPQRIPPVFNAIPQAQSVADQSFAASQNYYGNAAAYATGAFNPAATSPSVLGFRPGAPYHSRQPWNYPPQGPPYGRGAGGPNQMFPAMILQTNTADKTRPMLPAEICHVLPHVLLVMGNSVVPELQNTLDFMADTGAMTNTYKLSIMLDYCKRFPEHVRAMFDSRNGNYHPIPLAGAIGNWMVIATSAVKHSSDMFWKALAKIQHYA